jgi:4-amino-4-deoxy-L-arabinose transferase-like glycosyltransferase
LIELVAAAALLGVFRLARLLAGNAVAVAATLLTALYPIWFSQSTMAHADIFAAAFTIWALSFYFERNNANLVAILFSLAALSKETAIVTPLALAAWEVLKRLRPKWTGSKFSLRSLVALTFPVVPLVLWYAYHRHATGFIFGNPEFLRYNATANLSPLRILISLWHRAIHLFVHMNMFVPVVCALAMLPMPKRDGIEPEALTLPVVRAIAVILAANALEFSFLGGALLTRYLLPMYPLILIVCIALWQQRFARWGALVALSGVAFLLALVVNPPYSIAPEDNLTYRDFVTLHQRAATIIQREFPQATVLTAWPATAELEHPDLGYVRTPIKTTSIDNFSADEIAKAADEPGMYDTALVFSTKWVPAPNALIRRTEKTDTQFFDFHRDLSPEEIALALHGRVVWQASSHGEWAAILRFPRSNEARLRLP